MKYELAIFDLDGTILNTLDDLADSMNAVLVQNNYPVHTTDEIRFMVGNGIPKLVERAIPDGKNNPSYEKVLNDFIKYYGTHSTIKTGPYSGMKETLIQLKKSGIKLGVNSNKLEDAVIPLCENYFPGIFDYVSGGHINQAPKPDPAGVNRILEASKISKEKAVYIGDSDVDIATARNAGISEIGCGWGFRGTEFLKQHNAKIIIEKPEELLKILL